MIPKENYIGFRTDLDDYFKWMTGVPEAKKSFTPFIYQKGNHMYARWHWRQLFDKRVPEGTVFMQVWPGHFSCDCFVFTLEDLLEYLRKNKIEL